jgi:hypothetical protein
MVSEPLLYSIRRYYCDEKKGDSLNTGFGSYSMNIIGGGRKMSKIKANAAI